MNETSIGPSEQHGNSAAGGESNGNTSAPQAFAQTDIRRYDCDDGSIILENALQPPSPVADIMDRLDHWAQQDGGMELISEPLGAERRTLTYGEAAESASALAGVFISMGLESGDVVSVVAGAGCDHALVKFACLRARLVHVPLSPTLANSDSGRAKLADRLHICKPSLVLTDDNTLEDVRGLQVETGPEVSSLSEFVASALKARQADSALRQRMASISPDDTAAIYFTSGSTGDAKGVIITRLMISAVHGAISCHWPFLAHHRPTMVDWLPWHHVFGGLDNFFKMIWNGGTYHVRAAPAKENIVEAARFMAATGPTVYVDVPFGIKLLLDQLEIDGETCGDFFSRLELIFFAGAGMDAETWSRLNALVRRSAGIVHPHLRIASGFGATEAASTICLAHEAPGSPAEIGVPLPGTALRLVEVEGRTEMRVRGPNVSPGYVGAEAIIPMPLDEMGFLRSGDVGASVHPSHPERGLKFDGRAAEDFKLTNGTMVKVGALRHLLLAACLPYLADVAIAGEARDYLSALLFPAPAADGMTAEKLDKFFEQALSEHNARWPNRSMAIRHAMVMSDQPSPDAGEVNDKGHLVQRKCLENRQSVIDRLYAEQPDPSMIRPHVP
ncbi:MAG: AMP-binding protein [Alphaproteobacteria bacterium]|nr:AMP-binding protein [Alphaproteobacteria bacterium]